MYVIYEYSNNKSLLHLSVINVLCVVTLLMPTCQLYYLLQDHNIMLIIVTTIAHFIFLNLSNK